MLNAIFKCDFFHDLSAQEFTFHVESTLVLPFCNSVRVPALLKADGISDAQRSRIWSPFLLRRCEGSLSGDCSLLLSGCIQTVLQFGTRERARAARMHHKRERAAFPPCAEGACGIADEVPMELKHRRHCPQVWQTPWAPAAVRCRVRCPGAGGWSRPRGAWKRCCKERSCRGMERAARAAKLGWDISHCKFKTEMWIRQKHKLFLDVSQQDTASCREQAEKWEEFSIKKAKICLSRGTRRQIVLKPIELCWVPVMPINIADLSCSKGNHFPGLSELLLLDITF